MHIITEIDQLNDELRAEWLGKPFAIDTETTGLDVHNVDLIGVALYVNDQAYYFVRKHTAEDGETVVNYLTDQDLVNILAPIMTQAEPVVSMHNSKYDLHMFHRFNLPFDGKLFDTLIAAKLLNENRQNGLKELSHLVDVNHAKYKVDEVYKTFPKDCPLNVPLQPFAEYAMRDVIVTYKLWKLFRKEMAKDSFRGISVQDIFNNVWMPMIPVLREMESRGFTVDVEKVQELYDHYLATEATYRQEVQVEGLKMLVDRHEKGEQLPSLYWKICRQPDAIYTDEDGVPWIDQYEIPTPILQPTPRSMPRQLEFNLASPKQLIDLVLTGIELPDGHVPLELSKSGGDSVNVGNLSIIKHYLGDETPAYISALLKWRKVEKFLNTYLTMFLEKVDNNGRLHGSFAMAANEGSRGGTVTGRLSSSNPNLQQIPSQGEIGKEARALFVARESHVLIVADYDAMEMKIFAHYSKDPMLMETFRNGLDIHAVTACGQHNISYDQFIEEYKNGNPEYDKMRRTAKTLGFGQSYGMGALKLQRALLVQNGQEYTLNECKKMIEAFAETYKGMTDWKQSVIDRAGELGFVVTLLGRKRRLPDVWSPDRDLRAYAQRQGVNAIIQGSCADILFQAMPPIQAAFKGLGGGLVASVHDELLGEVPVEHAAVACTIMQSLMVDLINPRLNCPLTATAHAGKDWWSAKNG